MSLSLFGSFMGGDMDNDPFFGNAMSQMRTIDHMMNSMFRDPFDMLRDFNSRPSFHNSFMPSPFGMPPMMSNFARFMNSPMDHLSDGSANVSSSSTVISMTTGPDGRPQVYKATSSTKVAPGGVKETQKTVTDTFSGTKMMSIGHHIGDRAHIIEKEQNLHTGDREEREELINIDDEEKDEFNREWETKTRSYSDLPRIGGGSSRNRHGYGGHGHSAAPLAITGGPSRAPHDEGKDREGRDKTTERLVSGRRSIRSPPPTQKKDTGKSKSSMRTPYSPPSTSSSHSRKSKNVKTVSGLSSADI